jgi:hypothetical protein
MIADITTLSFEAFDTLSCWHIFIGFHWLTPAARSCDSAAFTPPLPADTLPLRLAARPLTPPPLLPF